MLRHATTLALLFATPLAAQAMPCFANFASNNVLPNWSTGGLWIGIKLQSPTPLPVTRIELFTGLRTGNSALELWSHDATNNQPLARLGGGTFVLAQPVGWQGATFAATLILPNTDFWMVWKPVGGEQVPTEGYGVNPPPPGAQIYRGSGDQGRTWTGPFQQHQWKIRMFCGNASPGAFTVYGRGCTGSNQLVPGIGAQGVPTIGQTFTLTLAKALPGSIAYLGLGASDQRWGALTLPLDLQLLGAPGCLVLTELLILLPRPTDAMGASSLPVPVPNDPTLLGGVVFAQWLPRDPTLNALQLSFSDGGRIVIGN